MSSRSIDWQLLALAVAVSALACTLRFSDLGTWSFADDETATLEEDAALFQSTRVDANTQTARLPRLVPVSYGVQHVGYAVFGRDEFGSRVVPALFGCASALLVFLLLDRTYGRAVAVTAGLLVTLWPEHVLRSQQNRFYIIAMFFASGCLLFGAQVVDRRSTRLAIITCVSGLLAVLSHSLSIAAIVFAFGGLGVAAVVRRTPPSRAVMISYAAALVALGLVVRFHVVPLARGWNVGEPRGYEIGHAVLASVNMVGWPLAALSAIGMAYMVSRRTAQDLYWLIAVGGWVGASLVLPMLVTYHPGYVFPLALSALVPAAVIIAYFHEALWSRSPMAAIACVALCCLLNLPSLVSYYQDGSRADWRSAAQFVRQRWQPGDRVTSFAVGFIRYYAPECRPSIPLPASRPLPALKQLTAEPGPLWVVGYSSRGGFDVELKTWLRQHCRYEREIVKVRYDYNENRVDVYRCPAK